MNGKRFLKTLDNLIKQNADEGKFNEALNRVMDNPTQVKVVREAVEKNHILEFLTQEERKLAEEIKNICVKTLINDSINKLRVLTQDAKYNDKVKNKVKKTAVLSLQDDIKQFEDFSQKPSNRDQIKFKFQAIQVLTGDTIDVNQEKTKIKNNAFTKLTSNNNEGLVDASGKATDKMKNGLAVHEAAGGGNVQAIIRKLEKNWKKGTTAIEGTVQLNKYIAMHLVSNPSSTVSKSKTTLEDKLFKAVSTSDDEFTKDQIGNFTKSFKKLGSDFSQMSTKWIEGWWKSGFDESTTVTDAHFPAKNNIKNYLEFYKLIKGNKANAATIDDIAKKELQQKFFDEVIEVSNSVTNTNKQKVKDFIGRIADKNQNTAADIVDNLMKNSPYMKLDKKLNVTGTAANDILGNIGNILNKDYNAVKRYLAPMFASIASDLQKLKLDILFADGSDVATRLSNLFTSQASLDNSSSHHKQYFTNQALNNMLDNIAKAPSITDATKLNTVLTALKVNFIEDVVTKTAYIINVAKYKDFKKDDAIKAVTNFEKVVDSSSDYKTKLFAAINVAGGLIKTLQDHYDNTCKSNFDTCKKDDQYKSALQFVKDTFPTKNELQNAYKNVLDDSSAGDGGHRTDSVICDLSSQYFQKKTFVKGKVKLDVCEESLVRFNRTQRYLLDKQDYYNLYREFCDADEQNPNPEVMRYRVVKEDFSICVNSKNRAADYGDAVGKIKYCDVEAECDAFMSS